MLRYLEDAILQDLNDKIVLLSGPRQAGKTTLAKSFYPDRMEYLNFDSSDDRMRILRQSWTREKKELVIFDELHKMKKWKQWLKGVYDKEGVHPKILVTGSARIEYMRKAGDSLAGRYFHHRLHPLSLPEVKNSFDAENALKRLLVTGPFPEPFLRGSETFAKRWRKTYLDAIIRQDLLDIEKVQELKSIELMVDFLSQKVGSPVPHLALAKELQVSPHTVKHWIEILEKLYAVFILTPYSRNIIRSIQKTPKIYFYDTGRVMNGLAAQIENIVACALLKRNHFLEDTTGSQYGIHYLRDHQQREIDFIILKEQKPEMLIEVKLSDDSPSKTLRHYAVQLKPTHTIQLVHNLKQEKDFPFINGMLKVRDMGAWLSELEA